MGKSYKPTGNPPGRPLAYQTVEELQEKIDAYFADRDTAERPYTIYGLALALDMDRKRLLQYEGRPAFCHAIKAAKERIRASVEDRIMAGQQNVAGLIFWLKNNAEWADKKEIEHKGNMNVDINIQGWSDTEDTKE